MASISCVRYILRQIWPLSAAGDITGCGRMLNIAFSLWSPPLTMNNLHMPEIMNSTLGMVYDVLIAFAYWRLVWAGKMHLANQGMLLCDSDGHLVDVNPTTLTCWGESDHPHLFGWIQQPSHVGVNATTLTCLGEFNNPHMLGWTLPPSLVWVNPTTLICWGESDHPHLFGWIQQPSHVGVNATTLTCLGEFNNPHMFGWTLPPSLVWVNSTTLTCWGERYHPHLFEWIQQPSHVGVNATTLTCLGESDHPHLLRWIRPPSLDWDTYRIQSTCRFPLMCIDNVFIAFGVFMYFHAFSVGVTVTLCVRAPVSIICRYRFEDAYPEHWVLRHGHHAARPPVLVGRWTGTLWLRSAGS